MKEIWISSEKGTKQYWQDNDKENMNNGGVTIKETSPDFFQLIHDRG